MRSRSTRPRATGDGGRPGEAKARHVIAVVGPAEPPERLGRFEQGALPGRHPDRDAEGGGAIVATALVAVVVRVGDRHDLPNAGPLEHVQDPARPEVDQEAALAGGPQEHVAGVAIPPQRRREPGEAVVCRRRRARRVVAHHATPPTARSRAGLRTSIASRALVVDAELAQERHDVLEEVGVAPAAPSAEARPDTDVLAEDDPVRVAVPDQRRDGGRHVPIRRRPAARTQQRVVEAEQVEPERRPAVGEGAQVVRPVDGRVAVAQDHPRPDRHRPRSGRRGRARLRAPTDGGGRRSPGHWRRRPRPPPCRTRVSAGWTGSDVPISPKMPGRIPVSPMPVVHGRGGGAS